MHRAVQGKCRRLGAQGGDGMEYYKKADLKVECIAAQDDLDFFGITFDDILDRTPQGLQSGMDECRVHAQHNDAFRRQGIV